MQERYVERIVIHDRYRPGMEVNDIALLKITPPVLCGRFVGPGCLPQFAAGPPSIPQKCWVIGWGYLRENALRPSPVLQEARVDLLDLDMCNSTQWYGGRIYSTNVCAGYPHGRIDTCQSQRGWEVTPLSCPYKEPSTTFRTFSPAWTQRSHHPNTAPEDGPARSCACARVCSPPSQAPHTPTHCWRHRRPRSHLSVWQQEATWPRTVGRAGGSRRE
nr:acrosin [Rousettus aegyptiacus]